MATPKNRIYWPNCSVCQHMKKHKDYRYACMRSTYFDPNGGESLLAVNERYGNPFKLPTLYRHMTRHQKVDIERAERLAKIAGEPSKVWQRQTGQSKHKREAEEVKLAKTESLLANTVEVIEADVMPRQAYEVGLDQFIAMGADRLKHGEMSISAANYISAIKVKAEIERTTKDRRLEMLKNMFVGAAPKKELDA